MTEDRGLGEETTTREFYCEDCNREFSGQAAFAGHLSWHRRQGNSKSTKSASASPVLCPVCGTDSLYYNTGHIPANTACRNCLAIFNRNTGRVVEPPPAVCSAENMGLPCPRPDHQYWAEQYATQQL